MLIDSFSHTLHPPPWSTPEAKEGLCWQDVLWDDPRSGLMIQHHCDLNAPKEPLNPIWTKEYITLSFLVFMIDTTIFRSKTYYNSLSCFKSGRSVLITDKSGWKQLCKYINHFLRQGIWTSWRAFSAKLNRQWKLQFLLNRWPYRSFANDDTAAISVCNTLNGRPCWCTKKVLWVLKEQWYGTFQSYMDWNYDLLLFTHE